MRSRPRALASYRRRHVRILDRVVVAPVGDVHQQHDRGDQVEQERDRMVHQLVDRLRDDAAGAERHETGGEQTERPDQEGDRHQQEEELGAGRQSGGRIAPDVVRHQPDIDGADDLDRDGLGKDKQKTVSL